MADCGDRKKQIAHNLLSLLVSCLCFCMLGGGVEIDITTLLKRYFSEERNREMYSRLADYSYIGERLTCQNYYQTRETL